MQVVHKKHVQNGQIAYAMIEMVPKGKEICDRDDLDYILVYMQTKHFFLGIYRNFRIKFSFSKTYICQIDGFSDNKRLLLVGKQG